MTDNPLAPTVILLGGLHFVTAKWAGSSKAHSSRAGVGHYGFMTTAVDDSSTEVQPEPKLAEPSLRKLVFLHLQKTAGTSFRSALSELFPEKLICPERHNNLPRWKKSDLGRFRFFSGHFKYETIREIPGPLEIVTVFREPKARVLSHYYFVKSHTRLALEENDPDMAQVKDMSLIEYLSAGAPGLMPYANQIGSGDVSTAKRRIRRMAAIGLAEGANRSLKNICRRLSLPLVEEVPWENKTGARGAEPPFEKVAPERVPVTPEILRLLDEITVRDREIYAFARRLFYWQTRTGDILAWLANSFGTIGAVKK